MKVIMATEDDLGEAAVEAVARSAATGTSDDGKTLVLDLPLARRMRTVETGSAAL